jgi:hypothetical protein
MVHRERDQPEPEQPDPDHRGSPDRTATERFDGLVTAMVGRPGVTGPQGGRGFGSDALRVDGRIFAMLAGGRLVVKLPRARVDGLVDGGHGVRFDANKGRPMKEWLSLDPGSPLDWAALAEEARRFVGLESA